jgi:hypothetical protein
MYVRAGPNLLAEFLEGSRIIAIHIVNIECVPVLIPFIVLGLVESSVIRVLVKIFNTVVVKAPFVSVESADIKEVFTVVLRLRICEQTLKGSGSIRRIGSVDQGVAAVGIRDCHESSSHEERVDEHRLVEYRVR